MLTIQVRWQGPFREMLPATTDAGVYAFVLVDGGRPSFVVRVGATNNFLLRMSQYCKHGVFGADTKLGVVFARLPSDLATQLRPLLRGSFRRDLRSLEYRLEFLLFEGFRRRNNGRILCGNVTGGSRNLNGKPRGYLSQLATIESPFSVCELPLAVESATTRFLRRTSKKRRR